MAVRKIKHPILNPDKSINHTKVRKHIKSDLFTPEEYVNMLSGHYHDDLTADAVPEPYLKNKHNTPENNAKVLNKYLKRLKNSGKKSEYGNPNSENINKLIRRYKLPSSTIHKFIENPKSFGSNPKDKYWTPQVSEINPDSLEKEHLYKIAAKHPDKLSDYIDHQHFDDNLIKNHLLHNNKSLGGLDSGVISKLAANPNLHGGDALKILESSPTHQISSETAGRLLDKIPENERHEFIDKTLGITGGHHNDEFDEESLREGGVSEEDIQKAKDNWNEDDNWDAWRDGINHSPQLSAKFAGYDKLKDHQIDHIMRHGDTDSKIKLYHNEKIDPKYGSKMLEKWYNDDSHHGYDSEHLKDFLKEENRDFVWEDSFEEGTEKARNDYSIGEYLSDNRNDGMSDEDIAEYEENGNLPDHVYEGYDQVIDERAQDYIDGIMDDHFDNSLENEDYIPNHIKEHSPIVKQLREKRRAREDNKALEQAQEEEDNNKDFLDQSVPKRTHEHEYGENLHQHEMLKDYADQNGGSIDVGKMHKMFPNLKDTWKQIFGNQGKLSSKEIQEKIDQIPKTKYNVSYRNWDGMQRTNGNEQVVFRLDHSPESLSKLKEDPELYDTFKKVQEVSQRSGHPTNLNTIGWARVDTSNPKHWLTDELQSDFGSTARDYLKREGAHDKAGHMDKIIQHHKDWRENLLNLVIKEAKKHGVEKVSTHSPESKAAHTGADKAHSVYNDSYKKVPRKMGFLPSKADSLPLDDEGREVFMSKKGNADDFENHQNAFNFHNNMYHAHHSNNLDQGAFDDPHMGTRFSLANSHKTLATQHLDRMRQIDPTIKYNSLKNQLKPEAISFNSKPYAGEYKNRADENLSANKVESHSHDLLLENKPIVAESHPAHTLDLRPKIMQKTMQIADLLLKTELAYFLGKQKNLEVNHLLKNVVELRKSLGY
ncbi:MAG TPA: hypothetical protein VI911_11915 [Patescibacteria group bacterium]|nr:hypothetical protein [Patescibacteria group bacterium]